MLLLLLEGLLCLVGLSLVNPERRGVCAVVVGDELEGGESFSEEVEVKQEEEGQQQGKEEGC